MKYSPSSSSSLFIVLHVVVAIPTRLMPSFVVETGLQQRTLMAGSAAAVAPPPFVVSVPVAFPCPLLSALTIPSSKANYSFQLNEKQADKKRKEEWTTAVLKMWL